jgi:hypothetical protein
MDWSAIITASASAITAVGGVIVAFTVLIPSLRIAKGTHSLVNQQRTDSINYQNALIRALKDKGIDVPIDQSQPNGGTQ